MVSFPVQGKLEFVYESPNATRVARSPKILGAKPGTCGFEYFGTYRSVYKKRSVEAVAD
jgi:hypothetical protein